MIDFIFKFKNLYSSWECRPRKNYSLEEISKKTAIKQPYLIKFINESDVLTVEPERVITLKEAKKIINILSQKYSFELQKKEEELRKESIALESTYQRLLERNNKLQADNNWEHAFKNLCYFVGEHEKKLSKELFINLCSDIVRSGIKSKTTNLQEVSLWLKKAVEKNLENYTQESLEDALDLIETYSSYFKEETSGKGKKALIDILTLVENPACELKLWQSYKECADSIFLNCNQ